MPQNVDREQYIKAFKEDIFTDIIVEKLDDADICYISQQGLNKDELYYIKHKNFLYHGNKVWSRWHSFHKRINDN